MEPLIPDKGFVFVRQQEEVYNSEIALVKVFGEYEDEVTIKRVRFRDGKVHLISENPEFEPMVYELRRIKILGKVVEWLSEEEGHRYLKEYL
jgi:SOS-response transcriptional repressor LexA